MGRIKQLSAQEAQKIAAGEVVERPANVVKELVENALDAGASQISIYIQESGKSLIRVVDNGHGMSNEDAIACFQHHATSKISSVHDLPTLTTFGFRGEALSSIAAVSKVTLLTKEEIAIHATQVVLEEATLIKQVTAPGNTGADISIADLFYNVPARKKFLKTNETEWRQILLLFQAYVLDYLPVHFKLFSQNNLLFNCPPVTTLHDRVAQLWDHTVATHMLSLVPTQEIKDIRIEGIISNHMYTRYDRSSIFFLVNKRWIKNHTLSKALLKGYLNVLPPDKFPLACITITLDPAQMDINIHPRKEEVQFLHPRIIENALTKIVKQTLETNLTAQLHKKQPVIGNTIQNQMPPPYTAAYPYPSARTPFLRHITSTNSNVKPATPLPVSKDLATIAAPAPTSIETPAHTQQPLSNVNLAHEYHILAQLHKTYILIEQSDGLFIVDQHAAHERILYEIFSSRFEYMATIELMFPPVITLTAAQTSLLQMHADILIKNRITIELIGPQQLVVKSVPIHLKEIHLEELVKQTVAWIEEYNHIPADELFKKINEKLHAQMACKGAIKAGDTLTIAQMHQLLQDLEKTNNRFTCPHGRPTGWAISLYEIEKKFKRR